MFHDGKIVKHSAPRTAMQIIVPLILLVLIGSFAYFFQTMSNKESRLLKDIAKKKTLIEEQRKDQDSINFYLDKYSDEINDFRSILFRERDIPLFIEGISSISKEHDVSVVSIKGLSDKEVVIKSKQKKQSFKELIGLTDKNFVIIASPFTIQLEGKLEDMSEVLYRLESNRQLLTVSDFDFIMVKYPKMRVNFRLDLYSLEAGKGKGKGK